MESVSLNDSNLNKQLKGYTLTREHTLQDGEKIGYNQNGNNEISRNYWENAIKVSEYLEKLYNREILQKTTSSQSSFEKFLKKLHVIQSLGILRDKPYGGQSFGIKFNKNWEYNFRDLDIKIHAIVTASLAEKLIETCKIKDDKYFRKFYTDRYGTFRKTVHEKEWTSPLSLYIPPPIPGIRPIERKDIKSSIKEICELNTVIYPNRTSILVIAADKSYVTEEESEEKNKKMLIIGYPSAKYIGQYLNIMRENLNKMFKERNSLKKINFLASAYQAGIRSQAFETVWNSEMMGIVNFLLQKEMNLKPISHSNIDFYAFVLSENSFCDFFAQFITENQ